MLASPGPEFVVDAQDKAAMAQDRAAVQNWRVQSAELSFPDDCAGALGIVHSSDVHATPWSLLTMRPAQGTLPESGSQRCNMRHLHAATHHCLRYPRLRCGLCADADADAMLLQMLPSWHERHRKGICRPAWESKAIRN